MVIFVFSMVTGILSVVPSIVIIEHNMDVIKCADHIIDIGPEGGEKGGNLVAFGTPEEIVQCKQSYTGRFLKEKLMVSIR